MAIGTDSDSNSDSAVWTAGVAAGTEGDRVNDEVSRTIALRVMRGYMVLVYY